MWYTSPMLSAEQAQRFAIIDLGSNTARLIILHAVPGFAYKLEDEIREVVRLREGMRDRRLSPEAMTRAFFTLQMFKRFCDNYPVDHIIATATSAVRDAANGAELLARIANEIGLELQILSGKEEAFIATLGALNEQSLANGYVLDIGGGSAQVSKIRHHRFVEGASRPLGALALTERYVNTDPLPDDCFHACHAFIQSELDSIPWLRKKKAKSHRRLIGLGGTIRNLAKIQAKRDAYPLNTLHGFFLSKKSVGKTIAQLRKLPLKERRAIPGLNPDRADIILPGAIVLQEVMTRLRVPGLTVSVNGLREGLFFQRFWEHLAYPVVTDVRRFTVLNMARVYNYQKNHAGHVRYLANRLFNQLQPLHNCTPADRELLEAAAILHDLGAIISYYDHHKHSQTLIINSGLPGYTPRETALIALLTRYHRKGKPSIVGFASILEDDDQDLLTKLTALLRLAEFLERGRNANVDDVAAVWDAQTMRITLVADHYPAVELWEAERNAVSLMETAFDREIILESTAVPTTSW